MLLLLNEWIFHDLLNQNGTVKLRETTEFLELLWDSSDQLVIPKEPRWLSKAYQLMKGSDRRQRETSKLLHRLLRNRARAVRVYDDLPPNFTEKHPQVPDEDAYLVFAYVMKDADVLITTDRKLYDALADENAINCQLRDEFLPKYPPSEMKE